MSFVLVVSGPVGANQACDVPNPCNCAAGECSPRQPLENPTLPENLDSLQCPCAQDYYACLNPHKASRQGCALNTCSVLGDAYQNVCDTGPRNPQTGLCPRYYPLVNFTNFSGAMVNRTTHVSTLVEIDQCDGPRPAANGVRVCCTLREIPNSTQTLSFFCACLDEKAML